ncbi:MAG: sterol desaturase family protein [Pseudobdellovibrionaceae bacterium]
MVILMPVFILAIVAEVYFSRNRKVYEFSESMSHLFTWVGQQVVNLFWISILVIIYDSVKSQWGLMHWPSQSPVTWIMLAFLTDFCWYWAHRSSHRVNFLWATHDTHHHAQDFNLVSALRQSWTSRPFIFAFFLPLAIIGFEPLDVVIVQGLNTAIQFFSHCGITTAKWKWLEMFIITPRTHRVHHGSNEIYLDKNFGGVLSIWDRFFGTYQDLDEKIQVNIGEAPDFNHLDAWESNIHTFKKLFLISSKQRTLQKKISIWFQGPEAIAPEFQKLKSVSSAEVLPSLAPVGILFFTLLGLQTISVFALLIFWKQLSAEQSAVLGIVTLLLAVFTSRMLTQGRSSRSFSNAV